MFEELRSHSPKLLLVFLSATRTKPAAISGFVNLNWNGNIRQGPACFELGDFPLLIYSIYHSY